MNTTLSPNGPVNDVVEKISQLSVLELSELKNSLYSKFGVSDRQSVTTFVTPVNDTPVVEEKTEFDVVLVGVAMEHKLNVIKTVKELSGLGLKEAKELVDTAPKTIKVGLPADQANKLKEALEAVGGKVELR